MYTFQFSFLYKTTNLSILHIVFVYFPKKFDLISDDFLANKTINN